MSSSSSLLWNRLSCEGFSTKSAITRTINTAAMYRQHSVTSILHASIQDDEGDDDGYDHNYQLKSRREALAQSCQVLTALSCWSLTSTVTNAMDDNEASLLEEVSLGEGGRWSSPFNSITDDTKQRRNNMTEKSFPVDFVTYLSRILIAYDDSIHNYFQQQQSQPESITTAPNGSNNNNNNVDDQKLTNDEINHSSLEDADIRFAQFANSVQTSLSLLLVNNNNNKAAAMQDLGQQLITTYDNKNISTNRSDPIARHVSLLMAMLPPEDQPISWLQHTIPAIQQPSSETTQQSNNETSRKYDTLLSNQFKVQYNDLTKSYQINPSILSNNNNNSAFYANLDTNDVQSTKFGPLSLNNPLQRPLTQYSPQIYALFALSGATGCAFTHSLVIPLDVVKTRLQTTTKTKSDNVLTKAVTMAKEEGFSSLFLGAQATLAGYLWYGLSIYPLYTLFKRYLLLGSLSFTDTDAALLAGALAAVVASLGLTPLEACRIRRVAEPDVYTQGLAGTFQTIYKQNNGGWGALYAGLPSLMIRQVLFGTVKFLAFERARDEIFTLYPNLHDSTFTVLSVSLLAGAISGALSSIVSQPADSVLTYVAQNPIPDSNLWVGCQTMVKQNGYSSLMRGLGSRCLWASVIIAGQFLLYDVFRTFFGVNESDLTQSYYILLQQASTATTTNVI